MCTGCVAYVEWKRAVEWNPEESLCPQLIIEEQSLKSILNIYRSFAIVYEIVILLRKWKVVVQWHGHVLYSHQVHVMHEFYSKFNPRAAGVSGRTRRAGGKYYLPHPPKISRTTQRSDKRQTGLDSPERELSKACIFFKSWSRVRSNWGQKSNFTLFTKAPAEAKYSFIKAVFFSFWTVFR